MGCRENTCPWQLNASPRYRPAYSRTGRPGWRRLRRAGQGQPPGAARRPQPLTRLGDGDPGGLRWRASTWRKQRYKRNRGVYRNPMILWRFFDHAPLRARTRSLGSSYMLNVSFSILPAGQADRRARPARIRCIAFHWSIRLLRDPREVPVLAFRPPFPVFEEVHLQVRVRVVQRRPVRPPEAVLHAVRVLRLPTLHARLRRRRLRRRLQLVHPREQRLVVALHAGVKPSRPARSSCPSPSAAARAARSTPGRPPPPAAAGADAPDAAPSADASTPRFSAPL